ncbi:hypothetical protein O6H91_07G124800 [Diphasiastrum complanatum]|uniref:Uncharacterized protein n=1 Tax=Diphasiastrum complanatum TaxID=34168 RepID=A0ACC2D9I9_DIPCM|nr:hypothetical protein O6H91_07G124800 [Diphasiastrum complanatum]
MLYKFQKDEIDKDDIDTGIGIEKLLWIKKRNQALKRKNKEKLLWIVIKVSRGRTSAINRAGATPPWFRRSIVATCSWHAKAKFELDVRFCLSSMRSNQASVPFSVCVDGTNASREKCSRNKRKFPSETRPSLRITNKGSSKTDKEPENGKIPMSNFDSFQDSRSPCNSTDSYNAQYSHHQEQTASGNEVQLQRPEQIFGNYVQYISDRDLRVGIPSGHDQLCKYSEEAEVGNWDNDTERQLEELLIKYLESICNDAVKKVASYGYSMEEARKAVLRVGYCYRIRDVLSNLGEKSLVYLASVNFQSDEAQLLEFKELHKFILAEMVRALKDIRPSLKKGDALWCLIASDMNMAQAFAMQGASLFPTDSSSSINPLVMSLPSNDACLPATIDSLQPPNDTKGTPLTAVTTNSSSVHQASSPNAVVDQTTSFSDNFIPPREDDGSKSPVRFVDGQSESCLLTCVERAGKEHQNATAVMKPSSVSSNTFRSAASLCSTCSECFREDTALSIAPPVRLAAQPCSPSKVTTEDLLGISSCRERGKAFEEWTSPSTSSEFVQPAISLMLQNSPNHSGELPLREKCTSLASCSNGSPSDVDHGQNMRLALSSAHPVNRNVGAEKLQPGSSVCKTTKLSSPGTSDKLQLSNEVARVNGSSLSAAGKELSLAVASIMDCPKIDIPVREADESICSSTQPAKESEFTGVPDSKGLLLEELLHRVKNLEATLQERSKWAREKVAHAAKRLINDFSELKALRLEREEASRLKKEKQALEECSKKKISDMEIELRKTIGQVECTNTAVRRLEIENAEMRAEMEAAKLSAAESAAIDKVVAKRERKALKKEQAWERQRSKLQEEVATEKRKLTRLQLELSQMKEQQQAAEVSWRQEVKAKEAAINLAESERRAKEQVEAAAKRREDSLRRKVEADDRRHQDDIARLEDEIAHLSLTKDSSKRTLFRLEPSSGVKSLSKYTQSMQELRNINSRLLQEVADVQSPSGRDLQRDRECVMCMSEERSVVFLPCAHQVICFDCNNLHETQGMKDCPSCRTFIEQRIRVYGANA